MVVVCREVRQQGPAGLVGVTEGSRAVVEVMVVEEVAVVVDAEEEGVEGAIGEVGELLERTLDKSLDRWPSNAHVC